MTIRLSAPLQRKLGRRAKERGKTPSELVRTLLEQELAEQEAETGPTLLQLGRKHIGSIGRADIPAGRDAERELARWKPDRRG